MYYNLLMQKAIFDDFAEDYDSWFLTPVGEKVFKLELELLFKIVEPSKGMTMLDVGIGTGLFAMQFRNHGVIVKGIDPSEKMLEIAKKRGFDAKKGFGENIPFGDNSFDIVLSMTSIEFSREPDKFMRELVRVTKPSGKVVVAVLNLLSFYGISRRIRGIFEESLFKNAHFYSYFELMHLLKKYLKMVKINSSVFFNPSPPKFILKRAENLEKFGSRYLQPFGALLVGCGIKEGNK